MRRSAVSIPSNISEGAGRGSKKEFIQFLNIAKGSCNELETQIIISENLKYITKEESENLQQDTLDVLKMLSKLILSLKN